MQKDTNGLRSGTENACLEIISRLERSQEEPRLATKRTRQNGGVLSEHDYFDRGWAPEIIRITRQTDRSRDGLRRTVALSK